MLLGLIGIIGVGVISFGASIFITVIG